MIFSLLCILVDRPTGGLNPQPPLCVRPCVNSSSGTKIMYYLTIQNYVYSFRRNMDGVTLVLLYVVHNYFNAYYWLQNFALSWCLDQLPLERVSGPGKVSFSGWFFFPHHLRWAKGSLGPVAPPIDHLRNRAWPRTGHWPSLSSLSSIRSTIPAVRFTYIFCICMCIAYCWWVWLIRPTLCIFLLVWQV